MDPGVAEAVRRGNPVTFFDTTIGDIPAGRIKMELFHDKCPRVREAALAGPGVAPCGLRAGYRKICGAPFP